jgi:hypothetical protein
MLKSLVGKVLRQTNPARFPTCFALQEFLAKAIELGVVVKTGEGGDKTLYLLADFKNNNGVAQPTISLSQNNKPPIYIHKMPPKAFRGELGQAVYLVCKEASHSYWEQISREDIPSDVRKVDATHVQQANGFTVSGYCPTVA